MAGFADPSVKMLSLLVAARQTDVAWFVQEALGITEPDVPFPKGQLAVCF